MGLNNQHFNDTSIGTIPVKFRVIGMPEYDLDDNQEHIDKIQQAIEEGVKSGGVNFLYDDDLYTVEWKCKGMDFFQEEE